MLKGQTRCVLSLSGPVLSPSGPVLSPSKGPSTSSGPSSSLRMIGRRGAGRTEYGDGGPSSPCPFSFDKLRSFEFPQDDRAEGGWANGIWEWGTFLPLSVLLRQAQVLRVPQDDRTEGGRENGLGDWGRGWREGQRHYQ